MNSEGAIAATTPSAGAAPEPLMSMPSLTPWIAKRGMQMSAYSYAANNPIYYTDPTGLFPSGLTPGRLCNDGCTDPKTCAEFKSKPEEDNSAPLEAIPPAGQCSDSDAIYTKWGVVKIPNNCLCTVKCGGGNQTITCTCTPGYGTTGSPTWFVRSAQLPGGWQSNPLPQPPGPVSSNLYLSLWSSQGMVQASSSP